MDYFTLQVRPTDANGGTVNVPTISWHSGRPSIALILLRSFTDSKPVLLGPSPCPCDNSIATTHADCGPERERGIGFRQASPGPERGSVLPPRSLSSDGSPTLPATYQLRSVIIRESKNDLLYRRRAAVMVGRRQQSQIYL